jgi:hypothetical protein
MIIPSTIWWTYNHDLLDIYEVHYPDDTIYILAHTSWIFKHKDIMVSNDKTLIFIVNLLTPSMHVYI